MTTKVVKTLKQIALFSVLFLSMLSCETDIENLGTNIVENGIFDTQKYDSELVAYNQNILKRRAKGLGQYLLGVYENDDFGQLNASIVTQLAPSGVIDFGLNPSIDTVIVQIPYQRIDTNSHTATAALAIDLIGNENATYNLNIYELDEYLNTLDPTNPSEELDYFTDQTYSYNPTALYSGLFSPDNNDTVLYVKRPEVILDFVTMEHDIDTLLITGNAPSMKIPLNEDFFTDIFLQNAPIIGTTATLVEFFKGLYIEATEGVDPKASIMSLGLSGANVTIYYTNTIVTDETNIDLNGNGNTTDTAVEVRTKQSAIFTFSGITTNTFVRDYVSFNIESYITTPNTTNGDDRLYLQGAAGSFALIDLFTADDIEDLRNNNWLINEASLTFYVDQDSDTSIAPEQLFVYNYEENTQIADMFTEGAVAFDGTLQRDSDKKPLKYTINITDYISNILKSTDPSESSQLAVKVYNTSDLPTAISDTEIKDFSWTPKGVVIHGNQSSDADKRIKLEITYTELN
ncbi:MAG: DUF4270 domain-containing protein [Flavobacteriaceae bacterium]|nr:DUF4270 domain-containing protein [Flavobacteriaceae bacterium]